MCSRFSPVCFLLQEGLTQQRSQFGVGAEQPKLGNSFDMRPAGWSPLLAQTGSHIQRHTQEFNALEEVPSAETPWPLQLMLVCAVDKGGRWYKDQEM